MNIWSRVAGRWQRTLARWLARRQVVMRNTKPIISFSFDDFPRSALLTAGAILEGHHLAGTYYTSLGLAGQMTPSGQAFEQEDLAYAISRGHELGCHTYSHCHAWETSPRCFEAAIVQNREALRRLLPSVAFRSLSYPISCPRPGTKRRAARHFAACRSGGQTFNHGVVDLNHVAAFFLEQSRDADAVKEMIDRTCQAGGWLVFATHDVRDAPGRFGCTPVFFEKVVSEAVKAKAVIMPVKDAVDALLKRA